jgi:hypothetical protein
MIATNGETGVRFQADEANNSIFLCDGTLTAGHYHAWLHHLALG